MFWKKDDEEKSEQFFRRLQELDAERQQIGERKIQVFENGKVAILDLIAAERVLPLGDPLLGELQSKAAELKAACGAEENAWRAEDNEVCRQLRALTEPVILRGVERLRNELLPLKIDRKVIERKASGFDMKRRVIIETNEFGVSEIQELVGEAVQALIGMRLQPISRIENFVEDELKKIRAVDLSLVRKEFDEFMHARREWASARADRAI